MWYLMILRNGPAPARPRDLLRVAILLGSLLQVLPLCAQPLGLPPTPSQWEIDATPERIRLGKVLFNDTRLSSAGNLA